MYWSLVFGTCTTFNGTSYVNVCYLFGKFWKMLPSLIMFLTCKALIGKLMDWLEEINNVPVTRLRYLVLINTVLHLNRIKYVHICWHQSVHFEERTGNFVNNCYWLSFSQYFCSYFIYKCFEYFSLNVFLWSSIR